MAAASQAFYCLWQNETIAERLFELLSKEDICSVRVANSACCNLVTKRLFLRTNLTFTANTFTKPSRIQALSRIGHHIEHLTFHFAHSDATFLPPLIHPLTGREITYLYTPHTSMASVLARPKYGTSELGDILTQQYPPLFHAATNVPSFINAMKHMPNMRHLTIKTPGQQPKERYRRDIVDYSLISLRIAIERTQLPKLTKLSLSAVHPAAFNYLRPSPGFGSSPSSTRRWRLIRKLYISVESWDFYGPSPGLDQLKVMDDYIRIFAPQLDKFSFTWLGRKGPCPIALSGDPLFAPPRAARKLFAEVTSPMSPLPARPPRRPMHMPRVRYMQVRNATMTATQLRGLVAAHAASVREFDFEDVLLIRGSGSASSGDAWDEALSPLLGTSATDVWSRRSMGGSTSGLRSVPALSRSNSGSGSAVASSQEDECLPASSAAAAAASKELFDVDLEGMVFGGANDVDTFEAGVQEWAQGVITDAGTHPEGPSTAMPPRAEEDDQAGNSRAVDGDSLASDIEAAKRAGAGYSTKIKKRRLRKRKSRKQHRGDGAESSAATRADDENGSAGGRRYKHSRSDETLNRDRDRDRDRSRPRSHSRHRQPSQRRHRRSDEEEDRSKLPELPDLPETFIAEVLSSDDEAAATPPSRTRRSPIPMPDMGISAPIPNPDPLPVLLQPTVYDPSATRRGPSPPLTKTPSKGSINSSSSASASASAPRSASPATTPATTTTTTATEDDGLSAVQRSIEAELLLLAEQEAEEAAARSSALRRAKETVLARLGWEFYRRPTEAGRGPREGDSAAVMELPRLNLGGVSGSCGVGAGGSGSGGFASRFGSGLREGLFGRGGARGVDHRSLESQTALVPLIFSRS